MNKLPDDYFWKIVDNYEDGDKTVRSACNHIVDAHKVFNINDLDEAIADYERLTGREASTFVKNYLKINLQL